MIRRFVLLTGAFVLIAIPALAVSNRIVLAGNVSDATTLAAADPMTRNVNCVTGESVSFRLTSEGLLDHVVFVDKVGDAASVIPVDRLQTAIVQKHNKSFPALQAVSLGLDDNVMYWTGTSPDVMFWNDYDAFTFAVRGCDPAGCILDPALYLVTLSTSGSLISVMRVTEWHDAYPDYIETTLAEETDNRLSAVSKVWPDWLQVTPAGFRFTLSGEFLPYHPRNDKLYDGWNVTYHDLELLANGRGLAVIRHEWYIVLESEYTSSFSVTFYDPEGRIIGQPEGSWNDEIIPGPDGTFFACSDALDPFSGDDFTATVGFYGLDGAMLSETSPDLVRKMLERALGQTVAGFRPAHARRPGERDAAAMAFIPGVDALILLIRYERVEFGPSETCALLLSKEGDCIGICPVPQAADDDFPLWQDVIRLVQELY